MDVNKIKGLSIKEGLFKLKEEYSVDETIKALKSHGVLVVPFGAKDIRMVTHLEFDNKKLEVLTRIIAELSIRV